MSEERDLVLRARDGDREAFGALAQRCRPWLLARCFRPTRDPNTAEDLAQEALLLAYRDLSQLRDPEHFRSWLSQIASNVCRMHLRRVATRLETEATEWVEASPVSPAPDVPSELAEALATLDPESHRLVNLIYRMGLSLTEAATLTSLTPSAMKSRLHRIRVRLRKEMLTMAAAEAEWELRTVLLVEPEEELRESLRTALLAAGYTVKVLPTGEEAITAVRNRRGQLLVLDKHCVEPHWLEVMALVQTHPWGLRNVPICAIVDPGNERDVLAAWHAGASVCLTRPPAPARLVGYVKHLGESWGKGAP